MKIVKIPEGQVMVFIDEEGAFISNFFINPHHRGKGHGLKLLAKLTAHIKTLPKGNHRLKCEKGMVSFYAKGGFKVVSASPSGMQLLRYWYD